MAVGKQTCSNLLPVAGIRLGVVEAGIRKLNRRDLVIIEIDEHAEIAGVFTQNAFCAAPVQIAKKHLDVRTKAKRYLLINTGNANAGTGDEGYNDAMVCCRVLADQVSVPIEHVLPFSTGVIGEKLPCEKIVSALPRALANLSDQHWEDAAYGIMTTDTRIKAFSKTLHYKGELITITGIAKGAGMIKPNMATMLAFIATDACIAKNHLNNLLKEIADKTFNRITIDGDTSTNDACILIATGKSHTPDIEQDQELMLAFQSALASMCESLAQAIVRDGEGATKFVTVKVQSARNSEEALLAAYAVAHSPLVKTAFFASDPNWGRILAAVGRAGITDLDVMRVDIFLNDIQIVSNGARSANYTEDQGQAVMQKEEILIRIALNRGASEESVWTTDLSHDYVKINAEYRT